MFNLFGPDKSTQEIIDDTLGTNPFGWQYVPKESVEHLKGEAEKFYKEIQSLKALQKGYIHERDAAREINAKLLKEKEELKAQLKSIEEDGTEEHNAAIKLRQENTHLKDIIDKYRNAFKLESFKDTWKTQYDQEVAKNTKLEDKVKELENEIKNWRTGVMHWKDLYDEKADYVDELVKEVNGLRHLKKENVELMERVSEIDSDQNEAYRAEIFTLKNDIAVLKAKYQILDHNYQGCTKYRDEYKHQLNAANKENEALKNKLREYQDRLAESFSYSDMKKLQNKIDEQKEEIEKLKKDIVDYVFEKDNKINNLQKELNHMKAVAEGAISLCDLSDKTDYDLAVDEIKKTQDWKETIDVLKNMKSQGFEDYDPTDFVKTEETTAENLEQKHPMYPIHWGGYEPEKWSTTKVAVDDAVQAKLKEVYGIEEKKNFKPWVEEPINWKEEEVEFNAKELLKRVTECAESLPVSLPNELQEDKEWICPCNMCKHAREENTEKSWEQTASDLALRVVKLEKKIEELTIIKHPSNSNFKYFLEHGKWPWNNEHKE